MATTLVLWCEDCFRPFDYEKKSAAGITPLRCESCRQARLREQNRRSQRDFKLRRQAA